MEVGLIHLYHGDGKGKTTAAMGLAVRAAGTGRGVTVVQFLKNSPTGELVSLAKLGIPVLRGEKSKKFIFQMDEEEKAACRAGCMALLEKAHTLLKKGSCDLLVLDEVLDAVNAQMVPLDALLALLANRGTTEIVMTGRNPQPALVDQADYITHMQAQRHPYDRGIAARRGIEF